MKVALAGNPNCGKTTLFNKLTGSNQKVGNYPGVTVEKKEGFMQCGTARVQVADLPGIYSLSCASLEERIARQHILNEDFRWVINLLDSTNLERNLYLTVQLLEMELPVVLALNMTDELSAAGLTINYRMMEEILGLPVIPISAKNGTGVADLQAAITQPSHKAKLTIEYGSHISEAVEALVPLLESHGLPSDVFAHAPSRWYALKLLENDKEIRAAFERHLGTDATLFTKVAEAQAQIESVYHDSPQVVIAEKRYGFISGLYRQSVEKVVENRVSATEKIDNIFLNRLLGLPIFLGMMYLVFQFTFTLSEKPMEWIEIFFGWLGEAAGSVLPEDSLVSSLIIDGIIGGVGGVVVFLPNVIFLFLALAILESTGYMARAAFLMDRTMHLCGLHGKSFIPMISGFGCSVPAIMATRTLERERDRIVTMMVIPFMSCGARLPIYVLIIPAFFPSHLHANVLFSIYIIGILLAVLGAWVLRRTLFRGESSEFLMELPPYRIPTLHSIVLYTTERAWLYLRKAGTIILAISIILWFLSVFPHDHATDEYVEQEVALIESDVTLSEEVKEESIAQLEQLRAERLLEYSLLGKLGHGIAPIMAPLGFDWKLSTAFIGAFAAKEVFVAQLGIIFSLGEADEASTPLRDKLAENYSPLIGYCIMLFALISSPCMATFAVVKRESNSWKWPIFQLVVMTVFAWIITFIVYQVGSLIV
ncbi:ferrous iron transport protein B [Chrysiogenes arsenatis]|uniref:ferrous iron transport protein B n=1 Tax=Chrysiogenes arsenatis TaxID=309797 RepID=UPI000411B7B2|nr:ferrous iron transport protein B [Chrysiogenes arsenatis]